MNILVIRRDNIGDLVCTTPMLSVLRRMYPSAWIGLLVNQYNAAVVQGNPDVDAIFAYRKAKHRAAGESKVGIWFETARLMWKLRAKRIDIAICASPGGERYARMIGAQRIIPFQPAQGGHEVERCLSMLSTLAGGEGSLPALGPLTVKADPDAAAQLGIRLGLDGATKRCAAIHISARRPKQRWPVASFATTIRGLLADGLVERVLVFWAPGSQNDPAHPGDDEKLTELMGALQHDKRVIPVPTHHLSELVTGLSLARLMVCADGGAMHVAAGLGMPVACLFGDSDATRWHPWGVPQVVLQPASRHVHDISPNDMLAACRSLLSQA